MFETTENTHVKALEKANKALSYLEQLSSVALDLEEFAKNIPKSYREEIAIYIDRLRQLTEVLDSKEGEEAVEALTSIPLTSFGKSKIERLKLGGEIVKLRREGLSYKDIGTRFQLNAVTVSSFCKMYDAAKPSEKAKARRNSIFDTTTQLEDLGATIHRCLARLEMEDAENHVKYISELRQTIQAAQKWMERVSERSKVEEIGNIVFEVLADELPEKRQAILERFSSLGIKGATHHVALPLVR